jgi:hypothetical protein
VGNQVFSNNASALLAASINDTDLTVQVDAGFGALFPNPGASESFQGAMVNASGDLEIFTCTSRASDILTVVRGQEGTTAQAWVNGVTRVELRNTKETMEEFIQRSGDTMTGDLSMGGNDLTNARIDAPVITGGQAVAMALRGVEDDSSNEVFVPNDGTRATASGAQIMTLDDNVMDLMPVGAIILWNAGLIALPDDWQICDGTNGSPDLTDVFVRGAGGAYALNSTGGSDTAGGTTDAEGDHEHSGNVGDTAITEAQMPEHHHRVWGSVKNPGGGVTSFGFKNSDAHSIAGITLDDAGDSYGDTMGGIGSEQVIEDTGSDDTHTHANQGEDGEHTHELGTVETVPAYRAIYYVMKVA